MRFIIRESFNIFFAGGHNKAYTPPLITSAEAASKASAHSLRHPFTITAEKFMKPLVCDLRLPARHFRVRRVNSTSDSI
jgi:hypothetical protein